MTLFRRSVGRSLFLLATLGLLSFTPVGDAVGGDGASGTLQISFSQTVDSIDPPTAANEAARTLTANLFERLFDYHYLKRPFVVEPSLAAAMPEVSDDGLVWTIRLRRDARYADDPCFEGGKGRVVRADDVVFCLKRLVDARVNCPARWVFHDRIVGLRAFSEATAKMAADLQDYPDVPGLEVVDERTLRIHLTRRFPDLPSLLASAYASIYPPEVLAHYGDKSGHHPVGTGPYRVASFLPGRSLILARNPSYRERHYPEEGADGDAGQRILQDAGARLPLNDRVVVTFQSDGIVAWNLFLQGGSDLAEIPPFLAPDTVDLVRRQMRPDLLKRGITLEATPRLEVYFLAFNMNDPVFGNDSGDKGLAIRQALCLVDDVAWDVHRLYRDTVIPVEGPLLEEFPESDPSFMARWIKQPDESMDEVKAAAREALADAGFTPEEGVPALQMDVLDNEGAKQSFRLFQNNLADIGVTIQPIYGDWPTLRKRFNQGKARMWRSSWAADYPSAQTFFEVFYAPSNPDPIAGGYRNPAFDEVFEQALEVGPGEERTALYRELQEILCEDCPWRFRFRRLRLDATHDWFSNYRYNDLVPRWFEYCRVDAGKRTAYRR